MSEKRHAQEAKQVLEMPAFRRAVEYLETNYIQAWKEGQTPELRERAHARFKALEDVVVHLRTEFDRGEILRESEERAGDGPSQNTKG